MSGTESRETAARDIKRLISSVVRNDWSYDRASTRDSCPARPTSSSSFSGTLSHDRKVSEWRVREFDSSSSELEPQSSDHELDLESPSALRAVGDVGAERRRKRRRQMEEEMSWNEGLRVWMDRRDEWAGARTRREIRGLEKGRVGGGKNVGRENGNDGNGVLDPRAASASFSSSSSADRVGGDDESSTLAAKTEKTEASLGVAERAKNNNVTQLRREQQDQDEEQSTAPDDETKRKGSTETSITEPEQTLSRDTAKLGACAADYQHEAIEDDEEEGYEDADDQEEEDDDDEELDELLLPVAPSFIPPTNPIRATITPSIYPSIYTKVVVQGMTPTVPVNLADLTKALVQGWKNDGEWPPKPAVASIVLEDTATVPKKDAAAPPGGEGTSRRKNSITNAMRKGLHIVSHPFHHRRGSSSYSHSYSHSHDAGSGGASGPTA